MAAIIAQLTRAKRERAQKKTYEPNKARGLLEGGEKTIFTLPRLSFLCRCVGTKSVLILRLDRVKGSPEKEDDNKINFPPKL